MQAYCYLFVSKFIGHGQIETSFGGNALHDSWPEPNPCDLWGVVITLDHMGINNFSEKHLIEFKLYLNTHWMVWSLTKCLSLFGMEIKDGHHLSTKLKYISLWDKLCKIILWPYPHVKPPNKLTANFVPWMVFDQISVILAYQKFKMAATAGQSFIIEYILWDLQMKK